MQRLEIIPVMEVQDIFVGNKKYYELTKGKVKLSQLNDHPLLFQKHPSNTCAYSDHYLKESGTLLTPTLDAVSYNLIMDMVKHGFGIGYATKEFIKEELAKKKLSEIQVTPKIPKRFIGIAIMSKMIPNYSIKKLIDIMMKK